MKEAAGEANLTVIAIVLIGVIALIATPLINSMMRNTARSSCCQSFGFVWENGVCHDADGNNWNVSNDDGQCLNAPTRA